jgi:cytochrome c peroxidase
MWFRWLTPALVLGLWSCTGDNVLTDGPAAIKVPAHFPSIEYPEGNHPTKLRVELGRRLFYDTRLSADGSTSCATCHVQSAAFTDGRKISSGMHDHLGKRNAPTLANLAWMPYFMMEGGVPTLELQALAPLHDTLEMGFNMMDVIEILRKDEELVAMTKAAYQRDTIDPYVVTRALAAFQRTMISGDSRYDRAEFEGKSQEMNEQEMLGMSLFMSEQTRCSECHSGVFFTDFKFHNIGLYEEYSDRGRERVTYDSLDFGKFKTPTLRNIELTGPYMHDGSLSTLEEVVAFYNKGGSNHPNKDPRIVPLELSEQEMEDLVAFLKSLTDWNFVQHPDLMPHEN